MARKVTKLTLIICVLFCSKAAPQDTPTKTVELVATSVAPSIDGNLGDDAWIRAAIVKDLHQMDPIEFSEPSEATEFYVTFDENAL